MNTASLVRPAHRRLAAATITVLAAAGVVTIDAPAQAVAPPGPPSCTSAGVLAFTQSTPAAIATGPAVVTSTLVVSGAGTYLRDVDAVTDLTHTFPGDLDVTLSSPAGTVVTLTTDNAGTNDDAFNGTRWDDDANPSGQVPYTANAGLVTDRTYAVSTPAPTLVPEEAMGAFIGEDPNGTWTLTVSDDLAGDGGSLNSWSLDITSLVGPPGLTTGTASTTTPVAVPTGPAVVTSPVVVSGAGSYLQDVDAVTKLTHTFPADLDVTLTSPTGTVVTLTSDNAGTNDDVFNGTRWDDDADPDGIAPYVTNDGLVTDQTYAVSSPVPTVVPEEAMGAFIGENPNGTWTLTVSDDLAGEGGNLAGWTLDFDTASCDVAVAGVVVSAASAQTLKGKGVKVKSKVSATAEPVQVVVTGRVTIGKGGGRKAKTYLLTGAGKLVATGGSAKFTQKIKGSKTKAAKARARIVAALAAGRKVKATLVLVLTDEAGNVRTVTKKVKLKAPKKG